MSVPFVDLKRDIAVHREEYLTQAARVFDSGIFSLGPEVEAFERDFAAYVGVKHAIGVNGGTHALFAALLALGVGQGDEVLVPANTFIATAEAVVLTGATPVFCDVDLATRHLNPTTCQARLTTRTKVVIPVHLYGALVDMSSLLAWAKRVGVRVIEDAAQAHGARVDGASAGSFGDLGCFSFYPTKNLGAIGEGGAVVTNDDVLAERVRGIRLHGILREKYRHDLFGSNLKMEALQGAFLRDRLSRLDAANARRQEIARMYREAFADLPITCPRDVGAAHVYHLFVIETDYRDALQANLKERGIVTGVHYPGAVHLQPAFSKYGGREGDCPVVEKMSTRILSLPLFPELRDDEVREVIAAVRACHV